MFTEHSGYTVRTCLKPGDLGIITYLHGKLYSVEYGFDASFEPYVAEPLSRFSRDHGNSRQRIWVLMKDDRVCGCVAIVEHSPTLAQLRWLLLEPEARGQGLGRMLVDSALGFCRESGYSEVFLWTVDSLEAAAHLYKRYGFSVEESVTHLQWGRVLTEQKLVLSLLDSRL